jgi:hypothetical protein
VAGLSKEYPEAYGLKKTFEACLNNFLVTWFKKSIEFQEVQSPFENLLLVMVRIGWDQLIAGVSARNFLANQVELRSFLIPSLPICFVLDGPVNAFCFQKQLHCSRCTHDPRPTFQVQAYRLCSIGLPIDHTYRYLSACS